VEATAFVAGRLSEVAFCFVAFGLAVDDGPFQRYGSIRRSSNARR